jgi:hypothetical protein
MLLRNIGGLPTSPHGVTTPSTYIDILQEVVGPNLGSETGSSYVFCFPLVCSGKFQDNEIRLGCVAAFHIFFSQFVIPIRRNLFTRASIIRVTESVVKQHTNKIKVFGTPVTYS